MKEHNKITVGFVVQKFTTVGDKHICTHQEFIAGDQVDYENMDNEPIEVDKTKEVYQPFEMKEPNLIGEDGLKFVCPDCDSTRLECVHDGSHVCEIKHIDPDGDFDYDVIVSNGDLVRFQCLSCGFELEDGAGEAITDNLEVVDWIQKNCEQE